MSIGKTAHCKISHWGKRSKRWLSRILRNTSCRCCKGWHARNCAIFAWLTLQSEPSQYIWWRKSFVCRIWVGRAEIVKLLIESRADVNEATTSEKGEGPLFTAADFGKLEVLALLLRANAEIDQGRLIDGATPLFVSAQEGDNEIGQTRIKVGLQTVKHHSERGELDVVRSLVQSGASINQVTSDTGMSGHLQAVEFLIGCRAQINQGAKPNGVSPLFSAAASDHHEVVQLLIAWRAKVNQGCIHDGETPLGMAADLCRLQSARYLVEAKAEVNRGRLNDRVTPLFSAAREGEVESVQLLSPWQTKIKVGLQTVKHHSESQHPMASWMSCAVWFNLEPP